MRFDKSFLIVGLAYAVIGMGVGIFMASSHNHAQHVTHAHILLVGFVVSFIYAIIHKLWLLNTGRLLAMIQFILHQLAVIVMSVGLGLLYGGFMAPEKLEPFLASSSMAALAGVVLMIVMVVRAKNVDES